MKNAAAVGLYKSLGLQALGLHGGLDPGVSGAGSVWGAGRAVVGDAVGLSDFDREEVEDRKEDESTSRCCDEWSNVKSMSYAIWALIINNRICCAAQTIHRNPFWDASTLSSLFEHSASTEKIRRQLREKIQYWE